MENVNEKSGSVYLVVLVVAYASKGHYLPLGLAAPGPVGIISPASSKID